MSEPDQPSPASGDPREQVRRAEAQFRETERETPPIIHLEARDRSWIARLVMTIFSVVIAAALATFAAEGVLTGRWDAVATQTSELVRSAVLPIVTLILGYYFGRSGADERPSRHRGEPP